MEGDSLKLIVGLGNPGKEYFETRHNVGFMVLDKLKYKFNLNEWKQKKGGFYTEYKAGQEKIILLKPQKFINLSGEVVREYIKYFKINTEDIVIIHDDVDLKLGKIKLVQSGGSGGHNGIKNIEENIKTKEYKRIKIGVDKSKIKATKDHVLEKIKGKDKKQLDSSIEKAVEIIIDYFEKDFLFLMNKYNSKEIKDE